MQLKISIIKAILTHNTDIGSKMDPFVVIKIGHQRQKTRVLKLGGDMPQFNQTFTFEIKHKYQKFNLMVYDQDLTTNDLVGEMILDIKDLINQPKVQQKWYSLKYNVNKPAGKILLAFQCMNSKQMQFVINNVVKNVLQPNIHRIGTQNKKTSSSDRNTPIHQIGYRQQNGPIHQIGYRQQNGPIHQIGYRQQNGNINIQHSRQPKLSNGVDHQKSINYENGPYRVQQSINSNVNSNNLYSSLSSHQVNRMNRMDDLKRNRVMDSNNNIMQRSTNTIIGSSQNGDNMNGRINSNMYRNNTNQPRSANYMNYSKNHHNNIAENCYSGQKRVINSVQ